MKTYYVLWTYIANFSTLMPVKANTAEEALAETCGYVHDDFKQKATVVVFEHPPALVQYKGVTHDDVQAYRDEVKADRAALDAARYGKVGE